MYPGAVTGSVPVNRIAAKELDRQAIKQVNMLDASLARLERAEQADRFAATLGYRHVDTTRSQQTASLTSPHDGEEADLLAGLSTNRQIFDPFEDAVHQLATDLARTLVRKHADYGPLNISRSPGGPLNGLRVRMHDKLARINHLHESGAEPENEPLRDSLLDLAGYALIGLLVLDGEWPSE